MRLVAARPSIPGMRMSMSTTSGRCSRASATASLTVVCLADHDDVGLGVEQRAKAGPHERLIVGEDDRDHRVSRVGTGRWATTRKPPPSLGPASTVPPSAAARSRMPAMPLPGVATAADAVVEHLDAQIVASCHAHVDRLRVRVAGHVGECLLHDPVRGELDSGRKRVGGASLEVHLETSGAHAVDELVEVRKARRRHPRHIDCVAQHVERGAQLAQRVVARFLDRRERWSRLIGMLVEEMQGDAGLDVDQRDVVREHVVQLLSET